MAAGLSGFAQGLSSGITQGAQLGLAVQKNQRDEEMFALQKEKTQLELEESRKEAAYKEDLAKSMQELMAARTGGVVGGEAEDEFGQSVGRVTYKNAEEAKASGLKFKQGTVVERAPMDDIEFTKKLADTMLTTGYKYGKVSLEQINQARALGKALDKENVDEAVRTWLQTGDQDAVKKVFNKSGKGRLGDDVVLKTVPDPDGVGPPNVVAYKIGPDGKEQEVFNYQSYRFASISDDAYATIVAQAKTTATKEKGETFRLGAKLASDEGIAAGKNKIETAKLGQESTKALNDAMKNRFSGIFRNPIDNAESNRQKTIEAAIGQRAEMYLGQPIQDKNGKVIGTVGVQEAINRAQSDVFRDYKVDTSELAPKKK